MESVAQLGHPPANLVITNSMDSDNGLILCYGELEPSTGLERQQICNLNNVYGDVKYNNFEGKSEVINILSKCFGRLEIGKLET